jgi:hypothetical protein
VHLLLVAQLVRVPFINYEWRITVLHLTDADAPIGAINHQVDLTARCACVWQDERGTALRRAPVM